MNDENEIKSNKKARGGVIVPAITPVDDNDNVDEFAYRAVIRRCLEAGVDGIFAGGSAGMGPLLPDAQWQRAMEIAHDEVGSEHVLMGGVIATSTCRALQQISILDRIGFSTMVVAPTFYISLGDDAEMMAHFGTCRQATDMQMVVYNIPSCVHSTIPIRLIEDMATRGWTDMIKESGGDRDYFQKLLAVCQALEVALMQGNEPDIEWALSLGAAGIVPVCANYEPQTFVAAYKAAKSKDRATLAAAQKRISAIRDKLLQCQTSWISGIMYGISTLGIGSGRPLLPLQELSLEGKKCIDHLECVSA